MEQDTYDALVQALKPPSDYFGAITDYTACGWAQVWGVHRDSDVADRSNWRAVMATLSEEFEPDEWTVECSSHWAMGWCDTLLVRALACGCEDHENANIHRYDDDFYCNTCDCIALVRPIFLKMMELRGQLEDYPVLDEQAYSSMEYDEFIEYLRTEVDDAEACAAWLYETHSVCRADDLTSGWLDEWKQTNEKEDDE